MVYSCAPSFRKERSVVDFCAERRRCRFFRCFKPQGQLLQERARELADCHDQLEVAREAEDEYERRLDEEEAKGRRMVHALEVGCFAIGYRGVVIAVVVEVLVLV